MIISLVWYAVSAKKRYHGPIEQVATTTADSPVVSGPHYDLAADPSAPIVGEKKRN
jgi:hypothetical protein